MDMLTELEGDEGVLPEWEVEDDQIGFVWMVDPIGKHDAERDDADGMVLGIERDEVPANSLGDSGVDRDWFFWLLGSLASLGLTHCFTEVSSRFD